MTDAPHLWRKAPFTILLAALLVFGFFPRLLTDKIVPSINEHVLPPASATATAAVPAPLNLVAQSVPQFPIVSAATP